MLQAQSRLLKSGGARCWPYCATSRARTLCCVRSPGGRLQLLNFLNGNMEKSAGACTKEEPQYNEEPQYKEEPRYRSLGVPHPEPLCNAPFSVERGFADVHMASRQGRGGCRGERYGRERYERETERGRDGRWERRGETAEMTLADAMTRGPTPLRRRCGPGCSSGGSAAGKPVGSGGAGLESGQC